MNRQTRMANGQGSPEEGFTFVEIITVLGIIALMLAISLPSISDWRKNLNYRQVARQITGMLGEARGRAINDNLQYMVVVDPLASNYQIYKGNQTYNSSYTAIAQSLINAQADVTLRKGSDGTSIVPVYIQFNPNGTAKFAAADGTVSDNNISVNDKTRQVYLITVTPTGRVTLQRK